MKIDAKFSDTPPPPCLGADLYERLNETKKKIDVKHIGGKWEWAKRLCNDLEAVHYLPSNKTGISKKIPLSRAYFKLWEMLRIFYKSPLGGEPITSLHLAEGPGGFIECLADFRKNPADSMWGISLASTDEEVPNWERANGFLKSHPNVRITYGADSTGDLLHLCNLLWLGKNISADIITADGGFDFTEDFFNQETIFFRLFFAEVLGAILAQKPGGMFICKFFDFFTQPTVDLLYILSCCYDSIIIHKPETSRPANAERYLICTGFVRPPPHIINELILAFVQSINGKYYVSLLEKGPTIRFSEFLRTELERCVIDQIASLEQNIDLIINSKFNRINTNSILREQIRRSIAWCERNAIEFNRDIAFNKKYNMF